MVRVVVEEEKEQQGEEEEADEPMDSWLMTN